MSPDYIPAIITASVALFAATIAQIISHRLAIKREDKKDLKVIYQNLISPYLSDVVFYYQTETTFRKGDVERKVDPFQLVDQLSKNISYANTDLLNSIYFYQESLHFYDARGYRREKLMLMVVFWFLDYSVYVLTRINNPINRQLNERLVSIQKMIGLWYVLIECLDGPDAELLMSFRWEWEEQIIEIIDISLYKEHFRRANLEADDSFFVQELTKIYNALSRLEKMNTYKEYMVKIKEDITHRKSMVKEW